MCMDGVHTGAYLWTYEDQKWIAAVALSSSPPYLLRWSLANRKPMVRLGWLSREPRGYLSLPPPQCGVPGTSPHGFLTGAGTQTQNLGLAK